MKRTRTGRFCALTLMTLVLYSCAVRDDKQPPTAGGKEPPRGFGGGNLITPTFVSEDCQKIEELSFRLQRGANACLSSVTSFANNQCQGGGDETINAGAVSRSLPTNTLFLGPIVDTNQCSDVLTVKTGSPCRYVRYDSGGSVYEYCYHDFKRIDVRHCINHTDVCGPPHNP